MKRIITITFTLLFIIPAFAQVCIEDVRALIDEFIVTQSVDFITSNGEGYVGRGYFSSGGSQVFFFSAASGILTTPQSNGQPLAVSENGNYVLLSVASGNWNRWETATGNILPMPFPANLSGYYSVGVANDGSVFANLANAQNQVRGYLWTPANGWQTAGETTLLLRGISNDGNTRVGIENNEPVIWKASSGAWETMEGFDDVTVRINDISGNGFYVTGYFWDTANNIFAYRWSNGNVEIMPGNYTDPEGLFVTDNGTILASRSPNSRLLWWSGSSVTNFYDILIQAGLHPNLIPVIFDGLLPDGSGGTVSLISDDGFALVGYPIRVVRSTGNCTAGIAGTIYQYSIQGGDSLAIYWNVSGISGDVTLEWSTDGSSYTFIDNAPAMQLTGEYTGQGWYSWNVPYVNADSAYIRITAPGAQEILGPINITSPLSFINPLTGDILIAGETDTIKWEGVDSVNIYLSINYNNGSGVFNPVVENYYSALGKYIWQIPDTILSRKCVIMIEDASNASISVESGVFKIKPYILTKINPDDSNYVAFKMSSDKWSFGNEAINLWPSTWWNQFDYVYGTDPFTEEQYPPDFPAEVPWAFPDWPLFVNTFGTNECYWSTFLGVYKEAAILKWKNINSNFGGACSGFSVSSLMAFMDKDRFRNHYPDINNFTTLIELDTSIAARNLLNELWIHYFGRQHKGFLVNNRNKTPVQTLTEIKNMFLEEKNPAYLYIANNGEGGGAHAIVPYKVIKDTVNSLEYIHVYDNSFHTDETAVIIVSTSLNGGSGSWFYDNWPGWGGNSKLILMDSINSYYQTPIFDPDLTATYPARGGSNYIESYNSPASDFLIKDTLGRTSGFADNELLTGIPEVVPNFPPKPELTAPIGYFLPEQEYSIQMKNFQDSSSYFSLIFPDLIYEYSRRDAEPSQTDLLLYKDGLGISSNDEDEKVIEFKTISISADNEKVFSVKDISVLNSDSLFFQNEGQDKLLLKNYGSDKYYDLRLKYLAATANEIFEHIKISLVNNSSHQVIPDWSDLQNQPVKILIDLGNDGTVDDSIIVKNQSTDVEDEGLLLTPDSYNLAQNYPNPFNPVTTIQYSIPQNSNVTLKVYDILGNEVAVLVNEEKPAGVYEIIFDGSSLSSGVYFFKISAGNFSDTKKLILIK